MIPATLQQEYTLYTAHKIQLQKRQNINYSYL